MQNQPFYLSSFEAEGNNVYRLGRITSFDVNLKLYSWKIDVITEDKSI